MKLGRTLLGLNLFIALYMSAPARADGLIVVIPPGQVSILPYPYPFAPLAVKYHHVTVRILDQVAVTEVDQVFINPTSYRLEGNYIFPIPRGAQIDRFAMEIDGRMTEAELLDAVKARQIYEDIVRRMRDPALLEYAGQGLFKVRIFPIEPRSEKRVRLSYTQVLRQESGLVKYEYPLNTEKFSSQPVGNVSIKVDLSVGRDLQAIYSPSHSIDVRRPDPRHAVAGFEADRVRPDTDFQLYYSLTPDADVGLSVLTYRDAVAGEDGYFLLMASPAV
jgi:Ca-activated chloride channel family protein